MELCQEIDKVAFARHRRRFDLEAEYARDVDALMSLAAGGRVSVIVSPPLSVDERRRVHTHLRRFKKSATMFEEKLEIPGGQDIAYERTIVA